MFKFNNDLGAIQTTFKSLEKSAPDFQIIERGKCPQTGAENKILKAHAFGKTWTREIYRIDWAQGDYHPFAQVLGVTQSEAEKMAVAGLAIEAEFMPY